jgi:glycogen phosphorylase
MREKLEQKPSFSPLARQVSQLEQAIYEKLVYSVGRQPERAGPRDWFMATALAVRDQIVDHWMETAERVRAESSKHVYYLSIEYLIGRLLFDALYNLELVSPIRAALSKFDVDLDQLRALEPDAALGAGGLGRLAACFMDSLSALGIAAHGYGIRYDHGQFEQQLRDGWQHELPDDWLAFGNPWEFERPGVNYPVRFGGCVEYMGGDRETAPAFWYPDEVVAAVAHDTPVVGWRGRYINTLRLWSARATEPLHRPNPSKDGDYVRALATRAEAGAISRALYPDAETAAGQELRLRQEYFFTSASLQDIVQRHVAERGDLASLPDHAAIQLNDTHPAIAVAELMRILVDERDLSWHEAWRITTSTLNYTNHTLLPEALETWPVSLMNRLLPRHMQIIFLINWFHLGEAKARGAGAELLQSLSLIDERGDKRLRMAHLAFVGSRKVNGVSTLHTDLMRRTIFGDLDAIHPSRIVNKTNGITFRRWLYQANPMLTTLLVDALGERVLDDPNQLRRLERFVDDSSFQERLANIRAANKEALCRVIREQTGVRADPAALFDVQIKRIHEYKRQLLNILEAVALYYAMRANPGGNWSPRIKILAGKAAPTYVQAKLIIKLANDVARVINGDAAVGDLLKVVFLPNYNVRLAETVVPAADLSEQISTAGMEASGTGNMKLALNGALTIGTMDGANIEIRDSVGEENIFIFGLKAQEVARLRSDGFEGRDAVAVSPLLAQAIEGIANGEFSPDDRARFRPVVEKIIGRDEFMVAADFDAYWRAQRAVDQRFRDRGSWWRASLSNTARMGWFSADRAIQDYAEDIWRVPIP